MLHEEVRAARIAARMSKSEVARLAGVVRQQVHDLERGENVTLATLRKIAAVLPNLKEVTLGGLAIKIEDADLNAARRAARDLFEASKRLMAALGEGLPTEEKAPPREGPAGAVRYDNSESLRKQAEELEPLIDEIERSENDDDS